MDSEIDFFALFLALGETRLHEARAGLGLDDPTAKAEPARVAGGLVPLAVDAALLGAEGVSSLAMAIARNASRASRSELHDALETLAAAVNALGHGDASGARTDEAALIAAAQRIDRGGGAGGGGGEGARAGDVRAMTASELPTKGRSSAAPSERVDETTWTPS